MSGTASLAPFMYSGTMCSVYGCRNYSIMKGARSLFRFPKDPKRCSEWVDRCQREDLLELFEEKGALFLNRNRKICSDHFLLSDYNNPNLKSQGLKKFAVPSQRLDMLDPPEFEHRKLRNKEAVKLRNKQALKRCSTEPAKSHPKCVLRVAIRVKAPVKKSRALPDPTADSPGPPKEASVPDKAPGTREEIASLQEELREARGVIHQQDILLHELRDKVAMLETKLADKL